MAAAHILKSIKVLSVAVIIAAALLISSAARAVESRNLILSNADIEALAWRVENLEPWQNYFEKMKADVDQWRDKELDIPKRGGGWSHRYIASDSGRHLKYDRSSPHKHLEPTSGKYYEGPELDAAWIEITHKQNISLAMQSALIYRLTGEEWYGRFARSVLVRYAKAYHRYPPQGGPAGLGRITAQALGEAVWTIDACSTFDLLDDTEILSKADKKNVVSKLFLPAVMHIEMYPFGIHNIQVWESVAMLMAGLIAKDDAIVSKNIGILRENIEKGIRPEGMWFETSVGYHYYAAKPFETLATICHNRELDVCDGPKLNSMFTVMSDLAMPDGSLPALNDGGPGYKIKESLRPLVMAAYSFGDARSGAEAGKLFDEAGGKISDLYVFMYYNPQAETGDSEAESEIKPAASVHMPGTGITVLRRGGQYALLKYNPPSGGHDHADRLEIIYHDGQRELYPDRGTTAYGHPLYKKWYKTTEAHNTLMVDGQQQMKEACEALAFEDSESFTGVSARCDKIFDGVSAMRSIILTDDALLDVLHAASAEEHTYDYILHDSTKVEREEEQGIPSVSPNPELELNTRFLLKGPGEDVKLSLRAGTHDLTLAGASGGAAYAGTATGVFPDEVMPALMWRVEGKAATFVAVTQPAGAAAPDIEIDGDIVNIIVGENKYELNTKDGSMGRKQ